MNEDTAKPDISFFRLRCWRASSAERELVRKLYATSLLTPRERRTLAVYHSATYLHLQAAKVHREAMLQQIGQTIPDDEDARSAFFVLLENQCAGAVRSAWSALDSLAHEINLICWKQAGRQDLYHPYVQEKKISFYMVRQRLLASAKLRSGPVCRLLAEQTRDAANRAESYVLLSNLAMRALHRPLLLGCRSRQTAEDGSLQILLTEGEGMPQDRAFSLHDIDIISAIDAILEWLEKFIDEVYLALSANP